MGGRRALVLYGIVLGLFVLILSWWVVFFSSQGNYIVNRVSKRLDGLDEETAGAIRAATDTSMHMLLFEGAFLALLLFLGVFFVFRSLRKEVELQRQQSELLSAVTHELKSPIASARLAIESLIYDRVPPEKRERYLDNARKDLDRLLELVDRVMEAASMSGGKPKLALQELDLGLFATEAVQRLALKEDQSPIDVDVHSDEDVSVLADTAALETILRNLLLNAAKYGGDAPKVEVRVSNDAGRGKLSVSDDGPGLRGIDREALFDPFTRGGDEIVQSRPGMGLGLYLVAQLTKALGGEVRARNVSDEGGFRVDVLLPLAEA